MKTLSQLREEVLDWMDEGGDVDTTKTIVDNALNQANTQRATEQRWPWMLSEPMTVSTVVGQTEYVLDERVHKLDYVYNRATKRFLQQLPMEVVDAIRMGFHDSDTTSGNTQYFYLAGWSPIRTLIPTPSTLTVTSSIGETTSPTLYIEGEDASGNLLTDTLGPTQTSTNVYARVTHVRKAGGAWGGTATLTAVTGSVTLLTLTASQYAKQFPVLRLVADPTAVEVLEYRFVKKPRIMTADHELPDVPYPYSNILVWDALIQTAAYNEVDSEASSIWRANQAKWELNLLTTMFEGDTVSGWSEQVRQVWDLN